MGPTHLPFCHAHHWNAAPSNASEIEPNPLGGKRILYTCSKITQYEIWSGTEAQEEQEEACHGCPPVSTTCCSALCRGMNIQMWNISLLDMLETHFKVKIQNSNSSCFRVSAASSADFSNATMPGFSSKWAILYMCVRVRAFNSSLRKPELNHSSDCLRKLLGTHGQEYNCGFTLLLVIMVCKALLIQGISRFLCGFAEHGLWLTCHYF